MPGLARGKISDLGEGNWLRGRFVAGSEAMESQQPIMWLIIKKTNFLLNQSL